ncbi:hypothetical protein CBL_14259 [Carabus blaptoides fortunei]
MHACEQSSAASAAVTSGVGICPATDTDTAQKTCVMVSATMVATVATSPVFLLVYWWGLCGLPLVKSNIRYGLRGAHVCRSERSVCRVCGIVYTRHRNRDYGTAARNQALDPAYNTRGAPDVHVDAVAYCQLIPHRLSLLARRHSRATLATFAFG